MIEAQSEDGILWAMCGYAKGMVGDMIGGAADVGPALDLVTGPERISDIEGMGAELGMRAGLGIL
jgi:hypothetical protein